MTAIGAASTKLMIWLSVLYEFGGSCRISNDLELIDFGDNIPDCLGYYPGPL